MSGKRGENIGDKGECREARKSESLKFSFRELGKTVEVR